jgi:diaminohydroxyphosphoribosylaminopyrimidine deaminase/5-amino-6-(5-phosphoribosylamino)uracil reductase
MPTSPPNERDAQFMAVALRLAERGLGQVWPNPAVGCVVVNDDQVVGRGWTQPGGRPHAEFEALKRARGQALGATAYVTLEPCAHYGQTPPCTMALLHAGIRRAVIAAGDPDPRVDGRGIEQLRQAGVEVAVGLAQDAAERLNAGFFLRVRAGRPLITLKLATSLDGRIATRTGASRWITGEEARQRAHQLRASHDAIMVGSGTALADDPELMCRLPGLEQGSPVRIVLDGRLRLPANSRLVRTAREVPTWVITGSADPSRADALAACGIEIIRLPGADQTARPALAALAERGITRLLVEGGATLAGSLLRAGLVDRLHLYQAPILLGAEAMPGVGALDLRHLADAPRWRRLEERRIGHDLLSVLDAAAPEVSA